MTISLPSTGAEHCGTPPSLGVPTPFDQVRQFEAQLVDGGPEAPSDDDAEDDDEGG